MANFFVPEIGTRLQLSEDWTFSWYWERRNLDLLKAFQEKGLIDELKFVQTTTEVNAHHYGIGDSKYANLKKYWDKYFTNHYRQPRTQFFCYQMTFPKDSVIILDRYYIRKGNSGYSSITFRTESLAIPGFKKKPRFWTKLDDANLIKYV